MASEPQRIDFEAFAANLEQIFEFVRDHDQPVLVERNGGTYRLERDLPEDLWRGYDPERVKRAVTASAGVLGGVDIKGLIADLDAQREQAPSRLD